LPVFVCILARSGDAAFVQKTGDKIVKWFVGIVALLATAWAVLFLGVLPAQLVQAQSDPIVRSPADVDLEFDNVSIPVPQDSLSLSAWWMPAEEAHSVMLYVHGANGNKEDKYIGAIDIYAAFVERGYHVMAVDLRNHGGSDRSESGKLTFGVEEHRDVLATLDMIEQLAPDLPIIATGVSMGGATLIEASIRDPRLTALIFIDPLLDPHSASLGGIQAILGMPKALLGPTLWSAKNLFGLGTEGAEPLKSGKSVTVPMLIVQDPQDPVTLARYSQELAQGRSNITYHLMPTPAAGHPVLADAGGWGSHGAAFLLDPVEVLAQIDSFLAAL
jgi:uncharacterized protein